MTFEETMKQKAELARVRMDTKIASAAARMQNLSPSEERKYLAAISKVPACSPNVNLHEVGMNAVLS